MRRFAGIINIMADIGEPQREVTFEPVEEPRPIVVPEPVEEPVPA